MKFIGILYCAMNHCNPSCVYVTVINSEANA